VNSGGVAAVLQGSTPLDKLPDWLYVRAILPDRGSQRDQCAVRDRIPIPSCGETVWQWSNSGNSPPCF